jgi:Zn finger protein HypA/HybF involved in hydrogenase expression
MDNLDQSGADPIATPPGIACHNCGNDLKALPVESSCPTCQLPIRDSMRGYSDNWEILDDRPCLKCGYSLKSMKLSGVCPECGAPVNPSMVGNPLHYQDARYLRKLRTGARNIRGSINLMVLMALGLFVYGIVASILFLDPIASQQTITLVSMALSVFIYALFVVGCWKISGAPPTPLTKESGRSALKRIRVLTVLFAIVIASSITFGIMSAERQMLAGVISIILVILSPGIFLVLTLLLVGYTRKLAVLGQDMKLYKLSRNTFRRMVVVGIFYSIAMALSLIDFVLSEMHDSLNNLDSNFEFGLYIGISVSWVLTILGSLVVLVHFVKTMGRLNTTLRSIIMQLQPSSPATVPLPDTHNHPA